MSIPTFDPQDARLTAYAFGELDGAERAAVERLLTESPAAQAALAEIQDTVGLLRTELASEPTPSLTSDQRRSLEAHIAAQSAPRAAASESAATAASSPRRKWVYVAGSLAATVAGVALLLPAVQQAREASSPKMAASSPFFGDEYSPSATTPQPTEIANFDYLNPNKDPAMSAETSETLNEAGRQVALQRGSSTATEESRPQSDSGKAASQKSLRSLDASVTDAREKSEVRDFKSDGYSAAGAGGAKPEMSGDVEAQSRAIRRNPLPKSDDKKQVAATGKRLSGVPASGPAATAPVAAITAAASTTPPVVRAALPAHPQDSQPDDSKPHAQPAKESAPGVSEAAITESLVTKSKAASAKSDATRDQAKRNLSLAQDGAERSKSVAKPSAAAPNNTLAKNESELRARGGVPLDRLGDRFSLESESKLADRETRFETRLETRLAAPNAEAYDAITENEFATPGDQPLSTFSIDVDSASYANVRRFLTQGQLPPPNAVRIEELINYFSYDYPQPKDGQPFSVTANAVPCPWQRDHYLARVALKARDIDKAHRPSTNLVFLVDVSGSMQPANKLPLVKRGLTLLAEEMNENDRISIVTYAGDAGLKLEPTKGSDQGRIMQVIDSLTAGGSTNGAAGINLAYEQALRHFTKDGANRVILCTDGDFNVGVSSDGELVKLIEAQAKSGVFLSIFGFGMGNLKDSKLEKLADKGNGHYGYIDDLNEARKVFNEELVGTLYTVAKDVKLQVEFNPLTVGGYRLIGYENRVLAAKDFNDDTKDAGEIGAGHTVTALYEIVPKSKWPLAPGVDPLKYAAADKKAAEPKPVAATVPADAADDLFTVKLRFKQPDAQTSVKTIDYVVDDIAGKKDIAPSRDMLWAASVASFGMNLRHSKHAGTWTLADVIETADGAKGEDPTGRKAEFISLVRTAQKLMPPVATRSPQ